MDYTDHELYAAAVTQVLSKLTASLPVRSILDFGCGDGLLTHFVQQTLLASYIVGVDCDPEKIHHARDTYPLLEWHLIQKPSFPWRDQAFDLVYAVNVFHHIAVAERSAYMHELMRVVRKGGYGIFIEHNPYSKKAHKQFQQEHSATMAMIKPAMMKQLCAPYGKLSCSYHLADWPAWVEPYMTWIPIEQVYALVVQRI